jgi:hypothetical protein
MNTEDIKNAIRDLKLEIILDHTFSFDPDIRKIRKGNNWIFNKPYWKHIDKWKGKSVITGSIALSAFGLIERNPKDVDLLVEEIPEGLQTYHNNYTGMDGKIDVLGYFPDHDSNMNVDFFKWNKHHHIIEKEGYLFQHPFQILETKLQLASTRPSMKDFQDIEKCLQKIRERISEK